MVVVLNITQAVVRNAEVKDKRYDIRDSKLKGLFLRVETSGRKTWYINYRLPGDFPVSKNKKLAPGCVEVREIRKIAIKFMNDIYTGKLSCKLALLKKKESEPLYADVVDMYEDYVLKHSKSGDVTIKILRMFDDFYKLKISEITDNQVRKWQYKNKNLKGSTINRRMAALSGMVNWAVKENIIDKAPFRFTKVPENDSKIVIRYLSDDERVRLFKAIDEREAKRGKDYLKTAVILSLNTGIRKGTLINLKWEDISFRERKIYLRAEIMKGGKNAEIPLCKTAYTALKEWQNFTCMKTGFVFPGDGSKLRDTKNIFNRIIKHAGIENFTWHCMRHDFASRLAMGGVPIMFIQKLMCHATPQMTQRYAHLSMVTLKNAVNILEKSNKKI